MNLFTFNKEYYFASGYGNGNPHGSIIHEPLYGENGTTVEYSIRRGHLLYGGNISMIFLSCGPTVNLSCNHSWMSLIDTIVRLMANCQVVFLDTRVYLKNGLVETNLRIKPTDTYQYLQMNSCHPRHCKTAIPYRQALCLYKICS